MMGSAKQSGTAELMLPTQKNALTALLEGLGPEANQAIMQLLQPTDPTQYQDMYQQAFVDPAMQVFEQQALPAIQQRFGDLNASSSSALNQALGQSAADLSTMLGGRMGEFYMGQQELGQRGQLGGLGALTSAIGQHAFQPIIQERQGLAGPLIGALGQLGGAAIGKWSSRDVKENIRDYKHGLDYIKKMDVKKYDYKDPYPGRNKVGLIAEEMPDEVTQDVDGILHVDLYGLLAVSINAIKELTAKVEALEAR